MTATNENGCVNSASQTVTVVTPNPITISGDVEICENEDATLTASGVSSNISWTVTEDGTNVDASRLQFSTDMKMVTIAEVTGEIKATVTGNEGTPSCTTSSEVYTVSVKRKPEITVADKVVVCKGNAVSVTASSSTTGATIQWEGGLKGYLEYSVAPTKDSTLTVNAYTTTSGGNTCEAKKTVDVKVNALPTPEIEGKNFCYGSTAELTVKDAASRTNSTFAWSGPKAGEGATLTDINREGTYTVTETDANKCVGTATKEIMRLELPKITIERSNYAWDDDKKVCADSAITLVASANGATENFVWDQDGTTLSSATGTLNNTLEAKIADGKTTSKFTVTGAIKYADDVTCANTATYTATKSDMPTFDLVAKTVCPGANSTIKVENSNSTNTTYKWSWTDSEGDKEHAGSYKEIATDGKTTFTVVGTLGHCTLKKQITPTLFAEPSLNDILNKGDNPLCLNGNTQLVLEGALNDAEVSTVRWATNRDNNSITSTNTVVNPSINSTINVEPTMIGARTYTATVPFGENNQCSVSKSIELNVIDAPEIKVDGETNICMGTQAELTLSNYTNGIEWYAVGADKKTPTGNAIHSGADKFTPTITSDTVFYVTATSAEGCGNSKLVELKVKNLPTVTFSGDSVICKNSATTISSRHSQ